MNTSTTHLTYLRVLSRLAPAVCAFIAAALVPSCSSTKHAAGQRANPDFSSYETPLYEQIVNRIQAKVSAKLGNGPNSRDRYFIIPFGYQNKGNDPEFSHSFISVIRVLADGKQPDRQSGLRTGTYQRWNFEAYTVSWFPHDFVENPDLCVIDGLGGRLFPKLNKCPLSKGKCFNLEDTTKTAVHAKVAVGMWGPYEITKEGFDLGVRRKRLLDSGAIKYRADDRLYRMDQVAINCFHAMANLDEPFPDGGVFGTGFKIWGLNGTKRVLREYTTRANRKGLLPDPVDLDADRYGFVYATARDGGRVYNPFRNASVYRR